MGHYYINSNITYLIPYKPTAFYQPNMNICIDIVCCYVCSYVNLPLIKIYVFLLCV